MPSASELLNEFYEGKDFCEGPVIATIEDVDVRAMKDWSGKDKEKLVLSLANHRRKIVVNKSSGKALVAGLGDDYAEWVGCSIRITSQPMMVGGKHMLVIHLEPAPAVRATEAG